MLAEDSPFAHAVDEDVGRDLLRGCTPALDELGIAADLGQAGGPVEGDPAHELRRYVVLRLAAGLPDALVRLFPDSDGALRLGLDDRPEPARQALALPRVQEDRVE